MSDFFEINGLDPRAYEYRFPRVEPQTFPVAWLPTAVTEYIAELEVALNKCDGIIERLNVDRIEARRTLRMRQYVEGLIGQ